MAEAVRARRAPSLEQLLRERSRAELSEYFAFWDGNGPAPKTSEELVALLKVVMTEEEAVRKRLKFLSRKLVDLLKFLLRDDGYTANREQVLGSRLFNYMSQYEVEAALNALQKRGFVFCLGERGKNGDADLSFAVPQDLGDVLSAFLWDEECPLAALFHVREYAKHAFAQDLPGLDVVLTKPTGAAELEPLLARIGEPDEIASRLRKLEPELLEVVRIVVAEAGGFAPKSVYERARKGAPRWDRRRFKRALESLVLGTVRHLALGEYGINQFDDTLVLFDEVVEVFRREFCADPSTEIDELRTCGVDLISDIANFLSFVAHNRIRLTLSGQIYRTVTKKLSDDFILSKKPELGGLDAFDYIYEFCVRHKLVLTRPDRSLHITVKGRRWEIEPLERKLKILLDSAFTERMQDGDAFHAPKLREHLLAILATQEVGRWIDAMAIPFAARAAYLARLEIDHVRDAFQNRYQYAPTAVMRDSVGLGQALFHWLKDRLYLLGIVDLAFKGDRVQAVRLTPLGARALGRTLPAEQAAAGRPIMVNPDFEVLLFPEEGDTYDLITRLDRFAERVSSDAVYRYRVTEASVEKAIAEGLDVAEILRVLSENARAAIPQNVVYSIKEWAQKVRFVSARRMTVLRGRNREIMDWVLKSLAQLGVPLERLSPTAIVVEDGADLARIEADLAREGIFLEGHQPHANGHHHRPSGEL